MICHIICHYNHFVLRQLLPIADGVHVWHPTPNVGWGLANCGLLAGRDAAAWIDSPYARALANEFRAHCEPLLAPETAIE
jgi:hypothetical protein